MDICEELFRRAERHFCPCSVQSVFLGFVVLSGVGIVPSVFAAEPVLSSSLTLNSSSACSTLGGTFVGTTCTLSSNGLQVGSSGSPGVTLTVASGYTLNIPSGATLDNYGTLSIAGTVDNMGTIMNHDDSGKEGATITILSGGTLINDESIVNHTYGEITNYGSLTNSGDIQNYGPIVNECGSTYTGAPNQQSPGTYENAGGTVTNDSCDSSVPQFPGLGAFGPALLIALLLPALLIITRKFRMPLFRA